MTSPTWPPAGASDPTFSPSVPGLPTAPPPPVGAHGARVAPRSAATSTRWLDALLLAVAGATVAGVVWWAIVGHSEFRFTYGAIGVGFIVGVATATGARRTGVATALLAATCTLVALVVAEYFIQRTLLVRDGFDVPLWQGFDVAKEFVKASVEEDGFAVLFWLLGAGAAAFTTFTRGR